MLANGIPRILWAALGLVALAVRLRIAGRPVDSALPTHLSRTLERLGPTFVKFGQALSLRRDLLPDAYADALQSLQDHVGPFAGREAVREIERGLGHPIDELFAEFDRKPFAAASVAQVHGARLADSREVVVKVRRPGIRAQVDRDMRALRRIVRLCEALLPGLARQRPVEIVDEVWANLRREIDFRQEARSIRRFAEAFETWPGIRIPGVVDELFGEAVVVQERSSGKRIDDSAIGPDGPRLAQVFVDAYLHQFFVLGIFHGDPHPGNLFVTNDGRICFHDFGLVGRLDPAMRRNLARFLQAFVEQDADWLLEAAIDLGIVSATADRPELRRGLAELLGDYAALPLKEWSLAEVFLRVMRLGGGATFRVPRDLLVLMRAMFLIENAVRNLDPDFRLLDSLTARAGTVLERLAQEAMPAHARLRTEAAFVAQDVPGLLAGLLQRLHREGEGIGISLQHHGLEDLAGRVDRGSNRVALALVTLGLYIAASLLMQHSLGPRVLGDMPLLAAIGYVLALWFTARLARAIFRSGPL